MIVHKPDTETVDNLIRSAQAENPNWQSDYLRNLVGELKADRLRYKSFGPFWWLTKQALVSAGYTDFGTTIDMDWYQTLSYDSEQRNIAAAYLYSDWATENGYLYASEHFYSYRNTELEEKFGDDEIWEEGSYILFDEEAE